MLCMLRPFQAHGLICVCIAECEQLRQKSAAAEAAAQFSISDAVEDGPDGFQAVTEQVATVAEEVERSQQATLMRRFKIAVTVYMIAFVAAFFVPAYGKDKDESQVILALWNALLLLFLLSLAWVFRVRDDANPYMFVGEDDAQNVHLDTRVRSQIKCELHAYVYIPI